MNNFTINSTAELIDALRSRGDHRVRLCGGGSRHHAQTARPFDSVVIALAGMNRIQRLEPDDLTCSVEPGVPCAVLHEELAAKGLELGIDADGTIGGFLAADPVTAATTGAASARSALLGAEAVLGEGKAFKAGSRVVKSVAGFDVHKLLIGSRGLLFAATLLHLKLRPRPPAAIDFCTDVMEQEAASRRFIALRSLAPAPVRLSLLFDQSGCRITGRFAGRANWVATALRSNGVREAKFAAATPFDEHSGNERLAGLVPPTQVCHLLRALPVGAFARIHGNGRCEIDLPAKATDALLRAMPELFVVAAIIGGTAVRRGQGTPLDAGAVRLDQGLKQALDPQGVFV
ncbi:MAG: FAD-binding oxidoreductase [Planctomycetes bacterium]|nr:FAD-binding oxidoreductase [Planctomycetota bacterium]